MLPVSKKYSSKRPSTDAPGVVPQPVNFLILTLIILFIPNQTFAFNMKSYINENKNQSLEIFLKNFPYDEYLKSVSFVDFSKIQEDRFLILSNLKKSDGRQDGDEFFYHLADSFLKKYPINLNQINKTISIGEAYLNPGKNLKTPALPEVEVEKRSIQKANVEEVYQTIGYYVLGKAAIKIKEEYKSKRINDGEFNQYADRLKRNRINISIREMPLQKVNALIISVISSIGDGRFDRVSADYLLDRSIIEMKSIVCKMGIWLWMAVAIFVISAVSISKKVRFVFGLAALSLIVLKQALPCDDDTSITAPMDSPRFKQIALKSVYKLNSNEHAVRIYRIKNNSGKLVGHSVWLRRPQIKADYYALSPAESFNNLRRNQNVVLATVGGYTTTSADGTKPDGFTVQSGDLNNAVLLPDRQGLVLFDRGNVRILNLEAEKIVLPNGDELESPYNNILSYSKLLNWCETNRVTVFQSHLLAYDDILLIDPSRLRTHCG